MKKKKKKETDKTLYRELQGGKEVSRGDDGTGRHLVVDLPGLCRLERHDHLHRLHLHERLARRHVGAVLLQEPDHLPGDVGPELAVF